MTVFVLTHSPLIGPSSWAPVAAELRRRGAEALVPDLRISTPNRSWWSHQVDAAVAVVGETDPVTLVAHSGAGPLLPAIGAGLRGRVAHYWFVDAALPHPGLSRLEALPASFGERLRSLAVDGVLPRWHEWFERDALERLLPDGMQHETMIAETPRLPLAMFTEALPEVDGWPDAPCSYLRLSAAYDGEAKTARSLGWQVVDLDGDHLSIMTEPERVVSLLGPVAG